MESCDFDMAKAAEMTLALMALGIHDEAEFDGERFARVWKGFDWGVMNHLHEQGFLADPANKAKSVVLTSEGLAKSIELFEQHFCKHP